MNQPALIELLSRLESFGDRTAIIDREGTFTYADLLESARLTAFKLLDGRSDLEEARVGFRAEPGFGYASNLLGVWLAGGVAVPLAVSHPRPELEYVIRDSAAGILVSSPGFQEMARVLAGELQLRLVDLGEPAGREMQPLPAVGSSRRAMILYTSGTTGKPKGVVTTHDQIAAQIQGLVEAWAWTERDHVLHVLPLHHLHGILNLLLCPLWSGAVCEFQEKFDPLRVWECFGRGDLTLFMAVPTIYTRLIAAWSGLPDDLQTRGRDGSGRMRLMVSGSAALPVGVLSRWREITGHTLLERYGMTEIGMALSNPLAGRRKPGFVGTPLPGVEVRLMAEDGRPAGPGEPGQIQVRGPGVFLEYWRRPEETKASFDGDWFLTGDTAVIEDGTYKILGRTSVDIIKTGGFKVSALEIEETLLEHPFVLECAVVGRSDPEWGQVVSAAVVLEKGTSLDLKTLRAWIKDRLAPYKAPRDLRVLGELPRNAMGKVVKNELTDLFCRD